MPIPSGAACGACYEHRKMMQATHRLAPLLLAATLTACASTGGDYPSLAIRDAERAEGTFEPAEAAEEAPAPPAPPSADLLERLAQLETEATAAHRAFLEAAPGARRAVASANSRSISPSATAARLRCESRSASATCASA